MKVGLDNSGLFFKIQKPTWLLLAGIVLITAANLSYHLDLLAWFSCVPFLLYLKLTKGLKSRLYFALALFLAWSLGTAKIISAPIPFALVFLFSFPIALIHLPGYLLWGRATEHKWGGLVFPATMAIMEWVQYTVTPFASWGIAAYTQSHNLPLMQSVSLFGMPGLSFLIYWVNASIAEFFLKKRVISANLYLPLSLVLLLLFFGSLRIDIGKSIGKDTVTLAAVGTDSEVSGLPLPSKKENEEIQSALFARTRTAACANSRLIVWNEAAVVISKEDEAIWRDSLISLAQERHISLVAAYIVPLAENPLKLENKYVYIDAKGAILYSYQKHEPVPGEPSIKGKEPLTVMNLNGSNIGGAICYDYDYPYLAKSFGKLKADIVAVPSSDWRGIDPLHTQMAAFRAIEQGHSVLRSTRFGLSAAINPYGEMVAQMSSFDANDKIMIAQLPQKKVLTVYSIVGDWLILLFAIIVLYNFKK